MSEHSVPLIQHWIDGAFSAGASKRNTPVYDPAVGKHTKSVAMANQLDIDAAVAAAKSAYPAWRDTSMAKRQSVIFAFRELLNARKGELARIITSEQGKVLSDALDEIGRGQETVEFATGFPNSIKGEYSENASTQVDVFTIRQPLGVVGIISPFNFPAMVPLWFFPVAIAAGNTVVLKPSEKDPSAANWLAALFSEAGLPDGVFNVLHGDKEAVDGLLDHPDVASISFVGSTPIARYIYETAARNVKRVQALGGAIVERVSRLKVGDGRRSCDIGPLITKQHRDKVASYIGIAEADGATVVVDGRAVVADGDSGGFWFGPTVIDRVQTSSAVYTDEIFGPVLSIVRVSSLDEGIAIINASPFGNGTAIFTADGAAARRFQNEVQVGMVGINVALPVPVSYYSFGGWKNSLFGASKAYGQRGFDFFTREKAVTSRWLAPSRGVEHA